MVTENAEGQLVVQPMSVTVDDLFGKFPLLPGVETDGDFDEIVQEIGKTPLPPIWALGNQQSRWSYFPESRVREIANGFRSNKIPADVIYLDIDYMDEYRVFTWNKERFPNPKQLVSDLAADGFKTVLIIDPGIKIDENYSIYTDGRKSDIFINFYSRINYQNSFESVRF